LTISTSACSDPTCFSEKNSLLSCHGVSDERDIGDGWLAMVEISAEGGYVVTALVLSVVVVVVVVVAAVVTVAVVVAVAVVESRLIVAEVVVTDTSKSMALLSATAMSVIYVNVMSVIGHWLWL